MNTPRCDTGHRRTLCFHAHQGRRILVSLPQATFPVSFAVQNIFSIYKLPLKIKTIRCHAMCRQTPRQNRSAHTILQTQTFLELFVFIDSVETFVFLVYLNCGINHEYVKDSFRSTTAPNLGAIWMTVPNLGIFPGRQRAI